MEILIIFLLILLNGVFSMSEIAQGSYNTLGGLLLHQLNHIPKTGEKLNWGKFIFEIVDMDGLRIDKVLITKK